ncbi:MAG: alpha-isopropylmalate synthase regulatory domain-containing protein [Nocardioides sp.]
MAYVLKAEHKLDLPRRAQIEFSRVIQQHRDTAGGRISPEEIWAVFARSTSTGEAPLKLNSVHTSSAAGEKERAHRERLCRRRGPDPPRLRATARSRRSSRRSTSCPRSSTCGSWTGAEHALSSGGDAIAAYVECAVGGQVLWGIGLDANIVTASLKAVISAVNRA